MHADIRENTGCRDAALCPTDQNKRDKNCSLAQMQQTCNIDCRLSKSKMLHMHFWYGHRWTSGPDCAADCSGSNNQPSDQ